MDILCVSGPCSGQRWPLPSVLVKDKEPFLAESPDGTMTQYEVVELDRGAHVAVWAEDDGLVEGYTNNPTTFDLKRYVLNAVVDMASNVPPETYAETPTRYLNRVLSADQSVLMCIARDIAHRMYVNDDNEIDVEQNVDGADLVDAINDLFDAAGLRPRKAE
jgi:hypothetical protein